MGQPQKKAPQKAADQRPEWMQRQDVAGGFMAVVDEVCRHVLRRGAGFFTEKGAVYFFCYFHSLRFGKEYVGRWVKSQRSGQYYWETMTRAEMAAELGILEENLRRALVQLEQEAMIRFEGKKTFVLINPRESEKLSPMITFDPQDPLFSTLESLKSSYREIDQAFQQEKQAVLAPVIEKYQPPLREVKSEIRKVEREARKRAAEVAPEAGKKLSPTVTFPGQDRSESTKPENGKKIVGDNEKRSPTITSDPALNLKEVKEVKTSSGAAPVLEALLRYGHADDDAAHQLLKACREKAEDATPEEVAHFIEVKGPLTRKREIENPIGFLIRSVPKCFEGESFLRYRQSAASAAAPSPNPASDDDLVRLIREDLEFLEAFPNHIQREETERRLARLRDEHPELYAMAAEPIAAES